MGMSERSKVPICLECPKTQNPPSNRDASFIGESRGDLYEFVEKPQQFSMSVRCTRATSAPFSLQTTDWRAKTGAAVPALRPGRRNRAQL
jgi:hypothetical protein